MAIRKLNTLSWLKFVPLLIFILLPPAPVLSAQVCDIDENGKVDNNDIQAIFQAHNQQANEPIDHRDIDRDGQISIYDARICAVCIHDTQICDRYDPQPKADAGQNISATHGQTVTLDGSGSTNFEGVQLSYHWTLITKPEGSEAILSDPDVPNPSFNVDAGEEGDKYVAQLIVSDGIFDSIPDTVEINIGNTAPVANAGPDQSAFVEGRVILDGSGSFDVNGDPLTYHWLFTSVPAGSRASLSNPDAPNPGFTIDVGQDGDVYVVQLIVNDGKIDSEADTVVINIGNTSPVADAGTDQSAFVESQVTLDGSGSTDINGDPLSYRWSLVSVPPGSQATLSDPSVPNPSFVVDVGQDGDIYVAQLIVNDGHIDSAADTVNINIGNTAPVADAGNDQSAQVKDQVTLDGSGYSDINDDPLTYLWSLTSVPAGSNATLSDPTVPDPSFVVDVGQDGDIYVAQLIVNDGYADSAADTVNINIGNTPPVADAGVDQTAFFGQMVTLDGSHSFDVNVDPLTYHWSLIFVPAGSNASLSDPSVPDPDFVVDVGGEGTSYVAQLIVNDGIDDSEPDTIIINIQNNLPVAENDTIVCDSDLNSLTKCTIPATGQVFECNLNICISVEGNVMNNDDKGDEPTTVTSISFNGVNVPVGSVYVTPNGEIVINSDGSYKYTPNSLGTAVNEIFEYTMTDAVGDTSTSQLDITITVPPSPPVIL